MGETAATGGGSSLGDAPQRLGRQIRAPDGWPPPGHNSTAKNMSLPGVGLIAFITESGPIRKILTHLREPLEPPPVSPARGPPTDWGELVQAHDDRDAIQTSPDELPVIDIHSP